MRVIYIYMVWYIYEHVYLGENTEHVGWNIKLPTRLSCVRSKAGARGDKTKNIFQVFVYSVQRCSV